MLRFFLGRGLSEKLGVVSLWSGNWQWTHYTELRVTEAWAPSSEPWDT